MKKIILSLCLVIGAMVFAPNASAGSKIIIGGNYWHQTVTVSGCEAEAIYEYDGSVSFGNDVRTITTRTYILGMLVSTETRTEECGLGQ